MTEHAVLIAATDLLPAMKSRLATNVRDLQAFTDAEALRALETITTRRPGLVVLEKKFASTPRGAALINRIKADPSLNDTQIQVLSHDGSADAVPTPAHTAPRPRGSQVAKAPAAPGVPAELDYRGTRRAPRFRIQGERDVLVDGNRGTLIDLSTLGAQLVTVTILKPNQRVRVAIIDDDTNIRGSATVVWASFEIPQGQNPRYRAGLDFVEPDVKAVDAYIRRHKQG
ncbi:MAG: PilZ domain-containing protein [Vicinamibacterales bacterium]